MADLDSLQRNLLNIDVWEVLIPIIDKHLEDVERLNREQLNKGERASNGSMPSYKKSAKNEIYIDDKISRGVYNESIYPAMNLYDTGSFHKGIVAKLDLMDGIYVESTDFKAEALEDRYGSTIFGLNDLSLAQFTDLIIDEFQQALLNEILKD